MSRLRIALVAGEASGDRLGAKVLTALQTRFDNVEAEGIGGPQMQAQGMTSLFPMERLSVIGLIEPLKRLPELLRMRSALHRYFLHRPPDLFLGIDAPDFNLRLERQLRCAGVTTAHLVSPSVWAWRRRRIRKIQRAVDLMLCLFPFETDIYREYGVAVRHVGHPMVDEVDLVPGALPSRRKMGLGKGPLLALLPGSRESEVRLLGPRFLEAARLLKQQVPSLSFAIPAASIERRTQLRLLLREYPDLPVTLLAGQSRELMSAADAVLLSSGTATLESALIGRPMVVAYRMGALSWQLMSRMLNTPYAALPNILAGKALVPEFIQRNATAQAMAKAVAPLLEKGAEAERQLRGFDTLRQSLGRNAADVAADALVELLTTGERRLG